MNNNLSLQFDRPLTLKEHVFWSNFFTNFPYDSNRYLQSWLEQYKNLDILMQHYDEIKISNSYDCLKDNTNIEEFIKANKHYELLCPEAKKENHFLMCVYGLACQECPVEVNREGVYIPKSLSLSNTNWDTSTIAITMAMYADLMAGRINHIYSNLKDINTVRLTGKLKLPLNGSQDIILEVEDLKAKRYMSINGLYHFDFQYSLTSNGDGIDFLSPFGKNQENFLKVLHHQKLDEKIVPKKFSLSSKKIKL